MCGVVTTNFLIAFLLNKNLNYLTVLINYINRRDNPFRSLLSPSLLPSFFLFSFYPICGVLSIYSFNSVFKFGTLANLCITKGLTL